MALLQMCIRDRYTINLRGPFVREKTDHAGPPGGIVLGRDARGLDYKNQSCVFIQNFHRSSISAAYAVTLYESRMRYAHPAEFCLLIRSKRDRKINQTASKQTLLKLF